MSHPLADLVDKANKTLESLRGLAFPLQCAHIRKKIDASDLFVAVWDDNGTPGVAPIRGDDFLVDIMAKRLNREIAIDAMTVGSHEHALALRAAFWQGPIIDDDE